MSLLSTTEPEPTWHRADGVELLGPVSGSGLTQATCLVRRQDGQVIQLSELLNLILVNAERAQTTPDLAHKVSSEYGQELTVEGLAHLIDTKLIPLGLLSGDAAEGDARPHIATADPVLALRLRGTILPARLVRRIASVLAPLYFPPLVVAALIGFVAMDVVLFVTGDALAALDQVLIQPVQFLALFGLLTLGALIHEIGHATACHYGGAQPGRIGFGLYLVFPAYFTNVTDSYRLGRAGRLRTDLGGLYFNVLCVLAAGSGYLLGGDGVLLLVVIVMQFQMLQQLPPIIRLDGYFVLADLAGVPDLFSRVGPVVRSLRPGRAADPRLSELRPRARRIVTIWVVTVIPLLVLALAWTIWSLPIIVSRVIAAVTWHAQAFAAALEQTLIAEMVLAALSIVFLVLPLVGLAAVFIHLSIKMTRAAVARFRAARRATTASVSVTPNHEERSEGRTILMSAIKPHAAEDANVTPLTGVPPLDAEPERAPRPSFITENLHEPPAADGWRGVVVHTTHVPLRASRAEQRRRQMLREVSRHWPGPRSIAVVNGKGGVGKTITTAMLAAVFARNGGAGVLAWDNNDTRGTLGWRTESGTHATTIQDLLPATQRLLSSSARVTDLAAFTHHQTNDKYDVLRSNPQLLATRQRIAEEEFDALHEAVTKYYRLVLFDSGNDESAPRWLRMIDVTDQLVVVTTALGEPAESGALLLEALQERDERSAELAKRAVVIVLQSEPTGTAADARRIAKGFSSLAREAVVVPFDPALHGGTLRFDALRTPTRRAWLAAAAAAAHGLS